MENATYNNIRFFDEAYFHFGGAVNEENMYTTFMEGK
jgi:hypothetical protein